MAKHAASLQPGYTYTARWQNGACRLEDPQRGSITVGHGVGWLVLSSGSCDVTRSAATVVVTGEAALTPYGLPLSTKPLNAWQVETDEVELKPSTECALEFWSVSVDKLLEAKNAGAAPADFGELRTLLIAGGRDPFLAFLQKRGNPFGAFDQVPHPAPRGSALPIELQYIPIEGHAGHDPWHSVLSFGERTNRMALLVDGWARYWANVGTDENVHERLVNLARSPVLIGDAYRPTARNETERAQAPLSRVDVRPIDRDRAGVHLLWISFERLAEWYDTPQVVDGLRRHSECTLYDLQRWLSVGLNYRWRVLRWLLDEDARRASVAHSIDRSIWIPKTLLGYKLVAGASQDAGVPGILNDAQRAWGEGNHNLAHLYADRRIELVAVNQHSIKVRVVDRETLETRLGEAACDRYPCPGKKGECGNGSKRLRLPKRYPRSTRSRGPETGTGDQPSAVNEAN